MGKLGGALWLGSSQRVIKIDPQESELRQQAAYLARLGNMGALEQRAAFAKWQMQETEAQFEKAKLIQANPSLAAAYAAPPRRWTVYLLTSSIVLLLGLQVAMFWRSQNPPSPLSERAPNPGEGSKVAFEKQGRAARSKQ